MIKCTVCQSTDERPVFRTNPIGVVPAGWMCRFCIVKHHDASLIDEQTQQIVNVISKNQSEKKR